MKLVLIRGLSLVGGCLHSEPVYGLFAEQPGAELPAGRNIRPVLFPQIGALSEKMHKRRKTPSRRCRARFFCSCEAQTVWTFLKVHAIQIRLSLHVFKLLNAAVLQLFQRLTHQNVRLVFLLWLLGFVQLLLFDIFSFFLPCLKTNGALQTFCAVSNILLLVSAVALLLS